MRIQPLAWLISRSFLTHFKARWRVEPISERDDGASVPGLPSPFSFNCRDASHRRFLSARGNDTERLTRYKNKS
jgi:hypothetical protein